MYADHRSNCRRDMNTRGSPSKKSTAAAATSQRLFVFGVILSLAGFALNFRAFQSALLRLPVVRDESLHQQKPHQSRQRRYSKLHTGSSRSKSVTPKRKPNAHPSRNANANETGESVALLISGQCHRFIYREQSGPLFRKDSASPTPYTLDVFITLQCGEAVNSLVGQVDTPPYMEILNITDIEMWYKSRGANSVTVQVLSPETMDYAFDETTHQATTVYKNNFGHKLSYMVGWPRWIVEVRKFYSRHVAFSMSQDVGRYSVYAFWREDNFFFTPMDLDDLFFSKNKPKDEPYVIVDKHCEFHAYSDKMYVANHLGAAMIFSSTKAEFMSWMKRYALFGFYRMHWHGDPLQPETFVHETLLKVDVEKVDLLRVDVRYVNRVKCVPALYFYCMPETTKNLAIQHNLIVCPKTDGAQLASGGGDNAESKATENFDSESKQDNAAPLATV